MPCVEEQFELPAVFVAKIGRQRIQILIRLENNNADKRRLLLEVGLSDAGILFHVLNELESLTELESSPNLLFTVCHLLGDAFQNALKGEHIVIPDARSVLLDWNRRGYGLVLLNGSTRPPYPRG